MGADPTHVIPCSQAEAKETTSRARLPVRPEAAGGDITAATSIGCSPKQGTNSRLASTHMCVC